MTAGRTDFTAMIRTAARRTPPAPARPATQIGDVGVGRGASCSIVLAAPPQPSFSSMLRASAEARRSELRERARVIDQW
jgi:hypothetical protein